MAFEHISVILERHFADLAAGRTCPCQGAYMPDRGDSVLETEFWNYLRKTKDGWHKSIDQFQIGQYRADCLINCDGQIVVVELDGRAFHKASADAIRDRHILPHVDALIRIPFAAMWYYPYATFKALASWFPRFDLGYHILCLSIEEFHEERVKAEAGVFGDTDWFSETGAYEIYRTGGNVAWVGSSAQMLYGAGGHTIVMQRGIGKSAGDVRARLQSRMPCIDVQKEVAAAA